MEQELNNNNDLIDEPLNKCYKVEYKNQNILELPKFKNWFQKVSQYVKNENIRNNYEILTISFCNNCLSYTICSSKLRYCTYRCNNCNYSFCLGCLREIRGGGAEETFCLKGYLKALYLRIIYRRSNLWNISPSYHFYHIIICLFFTPLYIGFLSFVIGLLPHRKQEKEHQGFKAISILTFSGFRGLMMIPYIITFFPFMIILLIPGIFSYIYYLYIFNMYYTAFFAGNEKLKNVGNY